MKKLNLTPSTFQKGDLLSRNQLKKVLGGDYGNGNYGNPGSGGPGSGSGGNPNNGTCLITITYPNGGTTYGGPGSTIFTNPNGHSESQGWCSNFLSGHFGYSCSYVCR